MNASTPLTFADLTTFVCAAFLVIVPFAAVGLSLINAGLGRSRSASHAMMTSLCVISVAALVYFSIGFSLQGYAGRPARVFAIGGKAFDLIGADAAFMRHLPVDGSMVSLAAWFNVMAIGIAALITLGGGAERWRLGACCASTAIFSALIYPLFGHWAWGGGWLSQLGNTNALGRGFVDAGGAGSIHALGGVTALAITWILGARRGKYTSDGIPTAMPGHNSVLVILGCLTALIGWWGLNNSGAILFAAIDPRRCVLVSINTLLSAAFAAITAAIITRVRFGKPDASLTANGWVGGLVASSAVCAFVGPAAAAAIGLVAGIIVVFGIELFELYLKVDDPAGTISVHGLGGVWSLVAVALFAEIPANVNAAAGSTAGGPGQLAAQMAGIATLLGFIFPLAYGLNLLLNRFLPQRVAPEADRQGMDLHELGAGAYPEFITHTEEFTNL